jgi:hypothetical protein
LRLLPSQWIREASIPSQADSAAFASAHVPSSRWPAAQPQAPHAALVRLPRRRCMGEQPGRAKALPGGGSELELGFIVAGLRGARRRTRLRDRG